MSSQHQYMQPKPRYINSPARWSHPLLKLVPMLPIPCRSRIAVNNTLHHLRTFPFLGIWRSGQGRKIEHMHWQNVTCNIFQVLVEGYIIQDGTDNVIQPALVKTAVGFDYGQDMLDTSFVRSFSGSF